VRHTILFVDDEIINLFVLKKRFEQDYDVLTAESGEEALQIIENNKNTLKAIITDLKMPGMDGLELIDKIKPDLIDIPCFLLTGFNKIEHVNPNFNTAKVQHLFKKPFDYEEIKSKLKEVIGNDPASEGH